MPKDRKLDPRMKDEIIIVIGPTGAGKSSFIETATRKSSDTIGYGLKSCTLDIRTVTVPHPMDSTYPAVVFVDTPGFDDTYKPDTEILSMIDDWLVKTYKKNVKLAGIIYLHRISDNRMTGTSLKNLHTVEGVYGQDTMVSVVLVTTMWDEIREEIGLRREAELKETFLKGIADSECNAKRFYRTFESAWDIVDCLLQKDQLSQARKLAEIPRAKDDRIILVLGPIGSGKSNFIANASGAGHDAIHHNLISDTSYIRTITYPSITFVDTPGFDDAYESDTRVFSKIVDWVQTYKKKARLAGIIYLHRIFDNRITGASLENIHIFEGVCGHNTMPSVVLVTTMWDEISKEVGERREAELKEWFGKNMVGEGCTTKRFHNTFDSAWEIINSLFTGDQAAFQLTKDIVDAHLLLNKTRIRPQ